MTPERAMAGVAAELFDCVLVNLAVLADLHHGPGAHRALGGPLRFRPRRVDGLPTVEPTTSHRLDAARTHLGVAAEELPGDTDLTDDPRGVLYVLADAHELPWVPYYQRQHMEHSFLVHVDNGVPVVLDAYHNDTPWGAARPVRLPLPVDALRGLAVRVFRTWPREPSGPSPDRVLAANAEHFRSAETRAAVESYTLAYRHHPDQLAAVTALALETWLLARSHALHARWLDDHRPEGAARAAEHARRWSDLAERAYIALRRLQRGRQAPPGLHDRLAELLRTDTTGSLWEAQWTSTASKSS
ncbi:hypothetical protein JOF41_002873 [Saccharothrix coeruleofusca]|uniref:hypothetical protein n=1 Tax=Saccharothrix coeruleofusca TaxID=33919 RepID=UPI001AEA900F|nr:hypothetical protein [Saccharothrix coeruleofusca]MBP2336695.1 hypothetical protein [Saccharothrix coeruleofusca]